MINSHFVYKGELQDDALCSANVLYNFLSLVARERIGQLSDKTVRRDPFARFMSGSPTSI